MRKEEGEAEGGITILQNHIMENNKKNKVKTQIFRYLLLSANIQYISSCSLHKCYCLLPA